MEIHYNTKYSKDKLPQTIIDLYNNPSRVKPEVTYKKLDLPVPNIFIPKNFDIITSQK